MKNIVEYLIELFLHLKYGEIYFCDQFSLKFPYFYIENSKTTKHITIAFANEFYYINSSDLFSLKFTILGFGFKILNFKWKTKKSAKT